MSQVLHVAFETPEHGWLPFEIAHSKRGVFREAASNVWVNDFTTELVRALRGVLRGERERRVVAWLEPAGWWFRFARGSNEAVRFFITEDADCPRGEPRNDVAILSVVGSVYEVCRPFVRALRELERLTVPSGEYADEWRREFPTAELAEASRLLRQAKG